MGDEATVAALVFVPGMSRSWSGQSLGNLAEDIGVSLDQASAQFKYSAAAGPALEYGVGSDSRSAHVVRISRRDESGAGGRSTAQSRPVQITATTTTSRTCRVAETARSLTPTLFS